MGKIEYRVISAPKKGLKGRGIKGADARYAHAIETLLNDQAAEGWQYLRAETLPSEERAGLANFTTTYRNVMVFQRTLDSESRPALAPDQSTISAAPPMPESQEPDDPSEADQEEQDDRARLKSAFDANG